MLKTVLIIIGVIVVAYLFLAFFGVAKEGSGCINEWKKTDNFCKTLNYEQCTYYGNHSMPEAKLNNGRSCRWSNETCRVGWMCQ